MLDDELTTSDVSTTPTGSADTPADAPGDTPAAPVKKAAAKRPARKTAAKKATAKAADAAPAADAEAAVEGETPPAVKKTAAKATAKKAATKRTAKKAATFQAPTDEVVAETASPEAETPAAAPGAVPVLFQAPTEPKPAKKAAAKRTTAKKAAAKKADEAETGVEADAEPSVETTMDAEAASEAPARTQNRRSRGGAGRTPAATAESEESDEADELEDTDEADEAEDGSDNGDGAPRRRRRRGGRRRRKPAGSGNGETADDADSDAADSATGDSDTSDDGSGPDNASDEQGEGESTSSRRRRRRRRAGEEGDTGSDDPANTVVRVRAPRSAEDEIAGFTGSTRLEAKKQRRREGREAGRRRAPIVSEAEFLARREAVDRVMVIRQHDELTQIAVMEDKVLVEHYVSRETQTSLIGNVYLGRVQNVLPSMEAAFIDIGKGRNAVLYAGEVNWDALGAKDGSQRKIESVLKSGQTVLVQVTKDPIGHKGARLTSQISLPGRFLVYVPEGTTSGISRKLPDTERNRLKTLLKEIVPESAGVIVRTAAEGASEDELTHDVERLKARWEDIEKKVEVGNAPQLLYGEPDLTLKVVRDLFTEDFSRLVISGDEAWDTVSDYVAHVAPDLANRLEKHDGEDAFTTYRIHEQIAKGLDRKVWLPSGGSLIIDRTEAMTVVDVNTGKFTGSGGNLEETVTKNNLEAAEEIVRQLRLRDIGGIIVVDFIDMVLESNRDLVLRRLVECLGRDRTRHQVAEVTSLGLVQMTRKRIGTGLLEAFSHNCDHCQGRGVVVAHEPVDGKKKAVVEEEPRRSRRSRGRGKSGDEQPSAPVSPPRPPSPADLAAMARHEHDDAGEPVVESELEPQTQETTVDVESVVEAEPVAEVELVVDELVVEAPEVVAPKVVTSVRRVSARRAAGPPAGVEAAPELPGLDLADAADPTIEGEEESTNGVAAHVPIKRKGRKR